MQRERRPVAGLAMCGRQAEPRHLQPPQWVCTRLRDPGSCLEGRPCTIMQPTGRGTRKSRRKVKGGDRRDCKMGGPVAQRGPTWRKPQEAKNLENLLYDRSVSLSSSRPQEGR
jgi:hypothetical protein